jgi:GMP synthase-like glutamine amidotransferase
MRVLAFRHVPHEHLGRIADAFDAEGIEAQYVDLASGGPAPEEDAAGFVFMGGPMSVNDDLDFIREEIAVIRRAAARGVPVLGVCLGAQLIARALGARVYKNPVKEIGFAPVTFHGNDALFEGLGPAEDVFHWHGETFDLPPGAELLASSERCRHQAFRVGEAIYGLQFHPEVTPAMIGEWVREDEGCGELCKAMGPIDPWRNARRLDEISALVFGRWSRMVLTSPRR